MTNITCPRCATTFETEATTATRCRRCAYVVHIGRSAPRPTPVRPMTTAQLDSNDPGDGLALVLFVAAAALAIVVPLIVGALQPFV